MKFFHSFLAATAAFSGLALASPLHDAKHDHADILSKRATHVTGTPVGFASSVTGGGSASPVYPSTVAQLESYLTDSSPRVIIISQTFNFVGTEGTQSFKACKPYACDIAQGGQMLLNTLGGCGTNALSTVTLDKAGTEGINVQSNKSLIGKGTGAVLNGKGLRLAGVSNVIIQNIKITNTNPAYVWGGDALVLTNTNLVWIDHVHTSLLGRQHYSFGQGANNAVTISNSFLDGRTTHSATCDGHTYWGLELVGASDQITFYKNYVLNTSGRSPALSGNTLFHAANNVFSSNSGHLIEGGGGMGLYEGNFFTGIPVPVSPGTTSRLFMATDANAAKCAAYLGRNCRANLWSNSVTETSADTSFLSLFKGHSIPAAGLVGSVSTDVIAKAGNTIA